MKKKLHHFISALFLLSCAILFGQCPPGNVNITSQLDVDDFAANYPNCTVINGFLSISGDVTDLSAFDDVTTVNADFQITECPNLTSAAGFENLTSTGNFYIYTQYTDIDVSAFSNLTTVNGDLSFFDTDISNITMNGITSVSGYVDVQFNSEVTTLSMNNIATIGGSFSISQSPLLQNFSFDSLVSTGDYCYIADNASLIDLTGLENLATINNYLYIANNPVLTSLNGLTNLTTINGLLQIDNNAMLASLTGLDNVNPVLLTELKLNSSTNLSTCNVESICNFLSISGNYEIAGNATGCSTVSEIIEACAISCLSSTEWNGLAWSNGIPTSDSAVIISGDFTSAGDLEMCSLTITNDADVIITTGDDLNVAGAINTSAGTLTFENNANLLQFEGSETNINIGAITYQREASMRRQDYVYWSSPVATQNLLAFSPETLTNRFYTLDEVNNAFVSIAPASNDFVAPNGYVIRAPNTFPNTVQTFTGVFEGTPNNGTYTVGITNSGAGKGYNLLGNPYPSPIDADDFLNENPGTLYFWTHSQQGAASGANYATYTNVGAAAAAGGETPNGFIQAGQGFLLNTATNGTATFTNAMRVGNNAGQFFRATNANTTEKHRLWINLSFGEQRMNQALIGYLTGATDQFDVAIDGPMNYNGSSISSIINTEKYSIQGRSLPFSNTDEVPLFFKAENEGTYSLTLDHVDGLFAEGQSVFIKDQLAGIVHNLTESTYSFASVAGNFANRFSVVYQSAPLAVDNPQFDSESVIVYKQNNALHINGGSVVLDHLKLFDISGRLLFEKDGINSTTTVLYPSITGQQMLLLQVTSNENKTITKKVMY